MIWMLMFRFGGTMTAILLLISTSSMEISLRGTITGVQSIHVIKARSRTIESRRISILGEIVERRIKIHLMLHLKVVGVHGIIHIGIALGDSRCRIPMHLWLPVRIGHSRRIITSIVIICHQIFIVSSKLARIRPVAVSRLLMVVVNVYVLLIGKLRFFFLFFSDIVFLVGIFFRFGDAFGFVGLIIALCLLRVVLTLLSACRGGWTLLDSAIKFLIGYSSMRKILKLVFCWLWLIFFNFLDLFRSTTKIFFPMSVIAVLFPFGTYTSIKVVTSLCFEWHGSWGWAFTYSELFFTMSESTTHVSLTKACLKLRTKSSLEKLIKIGVV